MEIIFGKKQRDRRESSWIYLKLLVVSQKIFCWLKTKKKKNENRMECRKNTEVDIKIFPLKYTKLLISLPLVLPYKLSLPQSKIKAESP